MPEKLIRFDWAMKKLLRSKTNFVILEGFLSELLLEDIKILEILESESNKDDRDDKFTRVDLLVKDSKGDLIIIEIQNNEQVEYFKRILFGVSKTICDFMQKGDSYKKVKKIISVSILYFDIGHGTDYVYKGRTEFKGIHNNDILELSTKQKTSLGDMPLSQIFPEYYLLKVNQFNDLAKNTLDEWIYFLKHEEIKEDFKAKGLKEAKERLRVMKMPPKDKKDYEHYLESLSDSESFYLNTFTLGKIEGILEGREEGREEGLAEGEKKKALEIAKQLLDVLDAETVSRKTGLTLEKIEKLK